MNVTKFTEANAYFPANHELMRCLRLQGHDAGPSDTVWIGASHILPGGGTTLDASEVEKFYIVLAGEVTIETQDSTYTLREFDSCRLAPREKRALKNMTNIPATVLLVMPYAPAKV
jgi:hypothetical protein